MLNLLSLKDLTQDIVLEMMKQLWRYIVYYTWSLGIPLIVGFATTISISTFIMHRVEYQPWKGLVAVLACLFLSAVPAYPVMILQEKFLSLIGKPNYFDGWDEKTPDVYDPFYDNNPNAG